MSDHKQPFDSCMSRDTVFSKQCFSTWQILPLLQQFPKTIGKKSLPLYCHQLESVRQFDQLPHFTISGAMLHRSMPEDLSPMYPETKFSQVTIENKAIETTTSVTGIIKNTTTQCCSICSAEAKLPCISPELCKSCWDKEHTCQKCGGYKSVNWCLECFTQNNINFLLKHTTV